MAKRKPVSYEDKRADDGSVTTRDYKVHRAGLEHARSNTIYFNCPFCANEVKAYVWSLCGGGKRCPSCKAMFNGYGTGFQFTDLITEDK